MKRIIWNNRKRIISSVLVMTVSFASINWNAFYAKAEVNSETQTAKKNYSKAKSKQAEKLLNTFLDIFQEDEPETVEKYELVNERTENSTTYQLSNGQKEIVFHGENVRYNDHDGKLMDYDASLKKISATSTLDSAQLESYAYENASGDTKNYIPKNLTEETPVFLTNGKYSVGISPVLADKDSENAFGSSQALEKVQTEKETVMNIYEEESKETTTAIYNSSDSSYSLEYISVNNGVKENIVLNEVPEGNIWRFEMNLKGLVPVLDTVSSGINLLEKKTQKIVGGIQAPNMNDATDNAYSEDIYYDIEKKAGEKDTYILSLIADEEYLKSKERVYPVTIDPTISWSSNSNINDVYVMNGSYADTNFFSSSVTTMCVGRGKQGLARTYLAFPNLDSKISGMSVASAKLTVYETGSNKGEGIQAHRVTQSWDKSTISWNNRANYNTTPLSSFTSTGITGQSSSLDLTSFARNIAKGTYKNYGVLLRANNETDSGIFTKYYSTRSSSTSRRPTLTVTYYDKPTTASNVSVATSYVKKGTAVKVNWEGINSVSLKSIQYKVMNYDEDTKSSTTVYSDYKNFASSANGTKTIEDSKSWPEGSYKIFIRGVDSYGGVSIGKGVVVRIDGTAPLFKTCKVSPVTTEEKYAASRPTLTWGDASDKNLSHIEYCVNDSNYRKLSSLSGSARLLPDFFGKTGMYTIKVRAVDKAGNYSKTYQFNYFYDVESPVFKALSIANPGETGNISTPSISWVIDESTLDKVEYSIDGSDYTFISKNNKDFLKIPEGIITEDGKTYTISVCATDRAQNITKKDLTYLYDTTAPSLESMRIYPETSVDNYTSCNSPVISWNSMADSSTLVNYNVYYNDELVGEESKKCDDKESSIFINNEYFKESGMYRIEFWASDDALNQGEKINFEYYYDGTGPTIGSSKLVKNEKTESTVYLYDVSDDRHPVHDEVYYKICPSDIEEITDVSMLTSSTVVDFQQNGNTVFQLNQEDLALKDGIYNVFIAVKDSLGNYSNIIKVGFYKFDSAVYRGESLLGGDYNQEDNQIILTWDGNENISSVDLFARYGTNEFTFIKSCQDDTEFKMDANKIETTSDYRILISYKDGKKTLSNVVTFEKNKEDDDVTYDLTNIDTDKDGLEDAYEIWDLNSDPNNVDSDGDGFNDDYEVFIYGTSPAIYNEDKDSDGDGISDLEEYKRGSNPFLMDSDFDGIPDNEDSFPTKTDVASNKDVKYTTDVPIGMYDLVETDENDKEYLSITNIYSGLQKQVKNDGNTIAYYYDSKCNNTATIGLVDGEYRATTYYYNSNDCLETIIHNDFSYTLEYDDGKNITGIFAGNRNLISYDYKKVDREEEEDEYIQSGIEYGNGCEYTYHYDNDSENISSISINGKMAYEMQYYEDGNIKSEKDYINNITHTYTYDDEGNVSSISGSNGFKIAYSFEEKNESDSSEEEIETVTKGVTYTDDTGSRVLNSVIQDNSTTNVINQTVVMINNDTLEYVINNNTSTQTTKITNSSGKTILSMEISEKEDRRKEVRDQNGDVYVYSYDKYENITSITKNGELLNSYEYDGIGELIRENNAKANETRVYSYDKAGNIKKVISYEYTLANKITSAPLSEKNYSYEENGWKDLLTSYNGQSITYDEVGNPLTYRDEMNFEWNYGQSLSDVNIGNDTIHYEYNMDGYRTQKIVNGTITDYTLENSNVIKETTGETTIWYIYDTSNQLIGFEINGKSYYYNKNIQGDIIAIIDADGNEVAGYEYDAWGNITEITGDKELAEVNPYRYRGYYYDNETGLYYLLSRYYDSKVGRFINADNPNILTTNTINFVGKNLFTYCENNPVNKSDKYGEASISVFWAAIIIDGFITVVLPYLLTAHKATRLAKVNKVLGGKKYNQMLNKMSKMIYNGMDRILYKLTGRAANIATAKFTVKRISNLLDQVIGLSIGKIIATIIDTFDKDKKSGRIVFW